MTNSIEIIEKIEGEAKLNFSFLDNEIDFVDIEFFSSRGIENILKGKAALDALVINPRVCGICGHAHLIATVKALESCYDKIEISQKAQIVRELTLNLELIQNHFKWFYLTIYPLLGFKQDILKAVHPSQIVGNAIATLGGQYPHNSYAIPGGITSKILATDVIRVENLLDELIVFVEENLIKLDIESLYYSKQVKEIYTLKGDLNKALKTIRRSGFHKIGKSYDRFLCAGESSYFKQGRSLKTNKQASINYKYVEEFENKTSLAKDVKYRGKSYEVGPLSRAMVNKIPLIKDSHRYFSDSVFSRVLARVYEIPYLLYKSKKLLKKIDLSEPSYIKPKEKIENISAKGIGVVEAARGSLIHNIHMENGKIKDYQIITPTQWNLSNGTKQSLGVSQKAMIGLKDKKTAELVFKSFDVCSVCTTH